MDVSIAPPVGTSALIVIPLPIPGTLATCNNSVHTGTRHVLAKTSTEDSSSGASMANGMPATTNEHSTFQDQSSTASLLHTCPRVMAILYVSRMISYDTAVPWTKCELCV